MFICMFFSWIQNHHVIEAIGIASGYHLKVHTIIMMS